LVEFLSRGRKGLVRCSDLPGHAMPLRVEWQEPFEGLQLAFRCLQSASQRAAALREFPVQRVTFGLCFECLLSQRVELFSAAVESRGGGPLEKELEHPGCGRAEDPQQSEGPAETDEDRLGKPETRKHHRNAHDEQAAEHHNGTYRQDLLFEQFADLRVKTLLLTGDFVEPLVEGDAASELRREPPSPFDGRGQIGFVLTRQAGANFVIGRRL
jgi:hypothetical protein